MKAKYVSYKGMTGNPRTICINEVESIVIVNLNDITKQLKIRFRSGLDITYNAKNEPERTNIFEIYNLIVRHLNVVEG